MSSPTDNRRLVKMDRRGFLAATAGAAAALALLAFGVGEPQAAQRPQAKRPNILLIMTDQHRWDFMGCAGHPLVKTPNLDRLAAEGVRFNTAYCQAPVCVPARMSIITGRYAHSHGAASNRLALPEDQQTIGHYFKTLGYQTGALGKMHFVGPDQHHGFDDRIEWAQFAKTLPAELKKRNPDRGNDELISAGISPLTEAQTYEHFLATKTIEWLERNGSEPFCLWFSMIAPHPPFKAPKNLYDLYAGRVADPPAPPADASPRVPEIEEIDQERRGMFDASDDGRKAIYAAYLGNITLADNCIGRVLEALDRLGLAENTVVVYTADHGDMQYEHGLFFKFVMFDGSARIPMIIRFPGHTAKGAVRQQVVEHVDLYPTLCELTGAPIPPTVQGRSLTKLLNGDDPSWPNTAFSELSMTMVRTQRYKCNFSGGEPLEVYDMEKDPREFYNLAQTERGKEVIRDMVKLRDDWMARTQPDLRDPSMLRDGWRAMKKEKGKKP